jgi:hypothetical protein
MVLEFLHFVRLILMEIVSILLKSNRQDSYVMRTISQVPYFTFSFVDVALV